MPKNIVVCCDGTGNEFDANNSNVVKLYQTLVCDDTQVAYYHPGVGTMGSRSSLSAIGKWWTRVIGLAFGYGFSDNVADAYQFLMRNYKPGDKLYVFGFSRGAYTARALCGMLHAVGLLTPGNEGLIPYAIRLIKKMMNKETAEEYRGLADKFRTTFSHPTCSCRGWCEHTCKPYFIGVWDTVSSLGWVYDAVHFPFTNANSNPDFHIVRHAMSIDERRAFFRQNSFREACNVQQDIKEVWFAGVHSDVGGSYPDDQSQLSKTALQWMLCEAEVAQLSVNSNRKADILGGKPPDVAPDPLTPNQHKSLHGWWWIAEFWPKVSHKRNAQGVWKKTLRVNLARRRWIPPDPCVHASVELRLKGTNYPYRPPNLPADRQVVRDVCAPVAQRASA